MQIGDKVPEFSLLDQNGIVRTNNGLKTPLVLFFYPKDDTPGCTLESQDFSKLNNMILKNNAVIYGISADSIQSHLKFKEKYKIKFQLLSDINKKVIKKYGVWGKKMFMGKNYMGIIRTTFLIDAVFLLLLYPVSIL